MGAYTNAEDLYTYMGKMFTVAFENKDLSEKLSATGVALKLRLSDPEAVIAVDFGRGAVQYGADATMDVEVDLEMSADIAHQFWLGKLNVPLAIAKQDIKIHGAIGKVMVLAPLMQPLFDQYEQILKDAGLEAMVG